MNYTNKFIVGRPVLWRRVISCLLVIFCGQVSAHDVFYVHTDRHGKTIMEDTLSDEARRNGYKIVNMSGVTLQTVEGESRAGRDNNRASPVGQNDWLLLQAYSKPEEIIAAKNRRLSSIKEMMDITSSNLATFENNLNQMSTLRAQLPATAPTIAKLEADIESVKKQIAQFHQQLARQNAEYKQANVHFDADLKRFKELQKSAGAK